MRVFLATLFSTAFLLAASRGEQTQVPSKVSPRLQDVVSTTAPNTPIRAWVYFADKNGATALEAERALTAKARARRERNGVVVDARDLPVAAAYVRDIARRGARVRHVSRWLNAASVEVDANDVATLAALPFVRRLDRVRSFHEPLLPLPEDTEHPAPAPPELSTALDYGPSYDQNFQIRVTSLHFLGYTGNGVLICMLDAGVNNLGHDALVDIDILITRDFVNGDSIVSDQPGQMGSGNHGTYTLGAIGGFQPGELIGPAYGATYILAKTENTSWERHLEEDDWIAGAEWADSIGADIISSSLGYALNFTNGDPNYSWEDMDGNTTIVVQGADAAASRGILVVNSAGNGGLVPAPANTLTSPADGDSVLAVGAVDATDVRVYFSSVGPTADGRIKPDVMARGQAVRTASPSDPSGYIGVSGTSLACPLVAGAAALLMEARPNASNAQIMDALKTNASQAGAPDRFYGWGVINAAVALGTIPTNVGSTPGSRDMMLSVYPNPFNPTTTIRYHIAKQSRVALSIFDVRGALVATLVDEMQPPGSRSVAWNGRDGGGNPVASGVYVCRLTAGGPQQSRKLVLLK